MPASSSSSALPAASTAGIVTDTASGERVVPQSRRADGSIRKERKVKPGFVPDEDVARFRPSRVLRARAEEREAAAKSAPSNASSSSRETSSQSIGEQTKKPNKPAAPLSGSAASMWASPSETSPTAERAPAWRRGTAPSRGSTQTRRQQPLRKADAAPDDWESDNTLPSTSSSRQSKASVGQASKEVQPKKSPALAPRDLEKKAASVDAVAEELASLDIAMPKKSSSEGGK